MRRPQTSGKPLRNRSVADDLAEQYDTPRYDSLRFQRAVPALRGALEAAASSVKKLSKKRLAGRQLTRCSSHSRANLSRGDYRFIRVRRCFRQPGWRAAKGGHLDDDHYYIKPRRDLEHGEEGVDYFVGEAALCMHAEEIRLFRSFGQRAVAAAAKRTEQQ